MVIRYHLHELFLYSSHQEISVRFTSSIAGFIYRLSKLTTEILLRNCNNLEILIGSKLVHNFSRLYNLIFFHYHSLRYFVEVNYKTAKISFNTWKELAVG